MTVHVAPPPVGKIEPLTAGQLALRSAIYLANRLKERESLSPEERLRRAEEYEASASRLAKLAHWHPIALEMGGRCRVAAQILRAEG